MGYVLCDVLSRVFAVTGVFVCLPLCARELPDTVAGELETVEVFGRRAAENVKSAVPSYGLTAKEMKETGVTDISDALHRLPGLNLQDYGGAGGMKTVSVRGFGATHTGVVYDGVQLSDAQSGRIDLSRYSLDNVGSLQMIVGDDSDIFLPAKASSSAANIIITTLAVPDADDPRWHFTGQFKAGSWWYTSEYVRLAKTVRPQFSFAVTGEFSHAKNNYPFDIRNGILSSRERRNHSRMNSGHGEIDALWRPGNSSSLSTKIYYYDNDRQLPGAVVLYNPVSHEKLHDRNFFAQATYRNSLPGPFSFMSTAKFNWDSSRYLDVDGKYPGGLYQENYNQQEAYITGSLLYAPLKILSLAYSADYFFNNLKSNFPDDAHPYRHTFLQALSAKLRIPRLLVTAKLLLSVYDNEARHGESAKDATKFSPSLNLSWQPFLSRLFFVRASYKNIFRMPTFNDSYFVRMGSTLLRPESTDQVNVGLTWQAGYHPVLKEMRLTIDGYINHVKDKIVAIPQNMFIWHMMNLEKVRAYGVDVTANVCVSPAKGHEIVFAGNYSYQRVQPRTSPQDPDYNKQTAYTPVHSGATSLGWKNPWVNLTVSSSGASCRYGTNTNNPESRIDGYLQTTVTLSRQFSLQSHLLELRADILNIFDKQYEVVARYPMPGRSWKITLTYEI